MDIRVIVESSSLSIVDVFQIAAGIGTVAAAIFALMTTLQNRKANKLLENERHMMVKPSFRVQSTFEQREERIIDIIVDNIGFNRVLNGIKCDWSGTENVKTVVKEYYESSGNSNNHKLKIRLGFSECKEKEVIGILTLSYSNILGKLYEESIQMDIEYNFNDITEEYIPILKSKLTGEVFKINEN
ncbi:hypothetical protein GT022_20035 [Agaribacter marinus]|uniref:Uncharacterized protein n=1 Tax=Virgibacillus salarius TaxID=447199 RepID=A0A941DVX8_9BACI|nr:hypothetical protein [Virgibacillus salarius]MBR7798294.1 hypothetical protein [Virgibacillus salarius]NAZ11003.1 hypothetical protein [Agaribacter marinus]